MTQRSRVAIQKETGSAARRGSFVRVVLWGFGALFVLIGGWLFFAASADAEAESRRADAALHGTPAEFHRFAPGTAVLLTGELVARERPGPEGFIVYRKESYLRTETTGASKGQTVWMTLSVPPPLIALGASGALVPICNRDYSMLRPPHRWQSDAVPTWRSVGDATIRLSGFKAGDGLTADGVVERDAKSAEPCLRSKAIFGGARDEYLATLRGGARTAKIVGSLLAGFGTLAMLLGRFFRKARV